MIEDDAFREEVEVSLRQATDGQLVRIMQFIERLPSRGQLDDVIAPVRGRLAMVRPVRSLTLGRVLTLPVEDLLVDSAHAGISPWVLPRDVLAVFHDIALRSLGADEVARLEALAAGATMDDHPIIRDMGACLWPAARDAIRGFLAAERLGEAVLPGGYRPAHRSCLDGIAAILEQADAIVDCLDRLPPRPMGPLDRAETDAAAGLLVLAGAVSPALLRFALTMLTRRAAIPAGMFTLLLDLAASLAPLPVAAIAAECAGECLIEIEMLCATLQEHGDLGLEEAGTAADDGGCRVQVAVCADRAARIGALSDAMAALPPTIPVDVARLAALRAAAARTLLDCYHRALTGSMRLAFARVVQPKATTETAVVVGIDPAGAGPVVSSDPVIVADAEATARAVARIQEAGNRLGVGAEMAALCEQEVGGYRLSIAYRAAADTKPAGERIVEVMEGLRLVEILAGPAVAEAMIDEIVTTA